MAPCRDMEIPLLSTGWNPVLSVPLASGKDSISKSRVLVSPGQAQGLEITENLGVSLGDTGQPGCVMSLEENLQKMEVLGEDKSYYMC